MNKNEIIEFIKELAGVAINIIPDKTELCFDIRLIPTQDPQEVFELIKSQLFRIEKQFSDFQYDFELLQSESAYLTDPDSEFVQLLQKNANQVLGKKYSLASQWTRKRR